MIHRHRSDNRFGKNRNGGDQMKGRMTWLGATCLAALAAAGPALAADETGPVIVVTAPLAADTAALSDVPANAQVLSGDPLRRQNHANLADLLNANFGSISLSNGTGSPIRAMCPIVDFRPPRCWVAHGLSVWLDGVRMNEPFGSTVNWDLIPLNAVKQVEVLPGSNPCSASTPWAARWCWTRRTAPTIPA
jgi:outer membrane receptor protein involved in Fe transport